MTAGSDGSDGFDGAGSAAYDLVTLGETMGLVVAAGTGPMRAGQQATISFGGAESNVAVGVARLGHAACWFGRLGDDPIGQMIAGTLRGEGIAVYAATDPERPTGLMLREHRTADRIRVSYYRRDLAGARLRPHDLDLDVIRRARVLHVSGITPALSKDAGDTLEHAVSAAKDAGVPVSFDVNYRSALWSRSEAAARLVEVAAHADIVFAGVDEADLLVEDVLGGADHAAEEGADADASADEALDPATLAASVAELGPREVVLKLGAEGAYAWARDPDHRTVEAVRAPAVPISVADPVGAGDAFVAGYLSALLDGLPLAARATRGNVCGAFAASVAMDWEGAPRRHELSMLDGVEAVSR